MSDGDIEARLRNPATSRELARKLEAKMRRHAEKRAQEKAREKRRQAWEARKQQPELFDLGD